MLAIPQFGINPTIRAIVAFDRGDVDQYPYPQTATRIVNEKHSAA